MAELVIVSLGPSLAQSSPEVVWMEGSLVIVQSLKVPVSKS